jgi:cell division initiation protein
MGLTPLDIHNKEFAKKFLGGYNTNAVDEFLDQVIREFETLIKENAHLKEQVEAVDLKLAQYRNLEETINNTLVISQGVAEDLKASAKKESDLIIQEARHQAERIIEAGQSKARRIADENADLSRAVHMLRTQIRSMLQAQLDAIGQVKDPFSPSERDVVSAAFTQVAPTRMGSPIGDDDSGGR